jgi:hypothetical protein
MEFSLHRVQNNCPNHQSLINHAIHESFVHQFVPLKSTFAISGNLTNGIQLLVVAYFKYVM